MTRNFEAPDGTIIDVRTDQAIRWRPGSCQCVLVFEQDIEDIDYSESRCFIHTAPPDSQILAIVWAHDRAINRRFGTNPTAQQKNTIAQDTVAEALRIFALGPPNVRADANTKASIESDLRGKGR